MSVAAAGATLTESFNPGEALTVIRNRGQISIQPQAFNADLAIVGAFGLIVVSNEAFVAGVGSIPEPFTDGDADWLVWRAFSYRFDFGTNVGLSFPDWQLEIDSKAMRKMGPNDVMVGIAESQQGAFDISPPIRTLVKLS